MKKIFTIFVLVLFQFTLAQNTTAPTGSSTEVGETAGQLSVSLSGAATYNIPIEVPPGLNGVVPQLSLNYSSQSGNGIAGYGWNIGGLSAITRIPSTKFHDGTDDPVDFDALDRFALDGQRLIVKAGTTGVYGANNTVYETENFSNVRITSFGVHPSGASYGPAWFKVEYPDGSVAEYGNSINASFPARTLTIWAITVWKNPQSVAINYIYETYGNTLYPYQVNYGSTLGIGQPIQVSFWFKNRERIEQYYINGVSFENTRILSHIIVNTQKIYLLQYEVNSLKYEKLKSITEKINDGSNRSLNPTTFEYGDAIDPTELVSSSNITTNQNINTTNTEKAVVGDFDGDGNSDYITIPKTTFSFQLPTTYSFFKGSASNNVLNTTIINGFIDIFPTTFLTGNTTNGFKMHPFEGWTVISTGALGFGNNQLTTINFNTYSLDINTNSIVLQQTKTFTPSNQLCTFPQLYSSGLKPYIKILNGDFNGDGITDVISIVGGKKQCNSSNINEVFLIDLKKDVATNYVNAYGLIPLTQMYGILNQENQPITEVTEIEVVDFNGDGKSDFMIFDYKRVRIFTLDQSNNSLKLLTTYQLDTLCNGSICFNFSNAQRYNGDFNGDGKIDLVYQSTIENQDKWVFLMSNGIGFVPKYSNLGINYEQPIKTLYSEIPENYVEFPFQIKEKSYDIQKSNFIAKDVNGDGKTDIVFDKQIIHDYSIKRYKIQSNNYPYYTWSDWYVEYANQGGVLSTETKLLSNTLNTTTSIGFTIQNTSGAAFTNFNAIQANTNIVKNNKFNLNSTSFSGTNIYSFALARNHKTDMLLRKVTTGNGASESIEYKPLKKVDITSGGIGFNNYVFYEPVQPQEIYPNLDIKVATGFMLVSSLEKISKNTLKKQFFAYQGAVANNNGLGFLGFKSSMRTDWFTSENNIFSNINFFDTNRRGAVVKSFKAGGFEVPNLFIQSEYLNKTESSYNTATDALQTNKVFKLKNTKTETWNNFDNTSSETTSVLDVYNNPTMVTSHIKNNGVIEKTTLSTIIYDNQPTAATFVIGRPIFKTLNNKIYLGQVDEDISETNEVYTYTNHLLTKIQKRSSNSGLMSTFLTEDNLFDAFGNITRKTITAVGETPRITNFEYSTTYGSRFLTKSIDVEGLETVYTYDPNKGLVLTELMPSNEGFPLLTTNTYDTWGKKIKVKNYLNKEINYAYTRDVEKTLITATSDDDSSTTELYDDLGRKIKTGSKTIDGTWAYTETQYDNFDRAIKTSEPYFEGATKLWNETSFDDYGRPLQIKAATGKIANYTYPAFLTVNVNDGTLNKTNVKNALGNVISLIDTPGGTITYNYFANGNLKKTTFEGQETIITQDGWGRKTKLIEPSAGEYNYTYNGFGQALTETSPNGTTAFVYDNIGKLQTKWVKGKPSPDGNFSGTNILSEYFYNANKMLGSIAVTNPNDGNSSYFYTYDDFKRIVYTKEDFTTVALRKFENTLTYDLFGRIEYETTTATINGFSSTKTVFNEYKNGELFKKRDNSASGNPIWTLNTRNARGQITSATLGDNLISQTNNYHDLGYTLQTKYDKLGTPNVNIMTLVNTYDYVQGNMLTRSNSLFSWNETFGYDALDRLTNYTNKNGAQITQEYENNGKIKNNALGTYRYSNAKPYQNTSIILSPDGLIEPGLMQTQTIVYSAFKAPLSIVQGSQRTFFGYNFAQDRSVMYFGNSNTNKLLQPKRRFYSADGTMEITMTLATTTLPASYEFTTYIGGDAYTAPALARQQDNQTSSLFYLHRDHLGTILAITNSLGDVVEKRLFDAWGDVVKVQNGAGVALTKLTFIDRGYTGHEHLQYFRLINMNGRLYDPRLHRFLQPDNNLQEPDNTQNYNRYAYCVNNPLKYTDPSGESFWGWVVGVIIKTFFTTAQATGEGNPFKWSAATWQNAGLGILSSGVSTLASDKLNSYVDNYGKHLAIDGGGKNPVEVHTFVTKEYRNEPPVSFFMRGDDYLGFKIFTNVFDEKNKKGNYDNNDSIFDVYGHGAVGYFGDGKLNESMTDGLMFDNRMSKVSLSYRRLINSGTDPKVINLYICESAKGGIESMAYLISKRHPNTTVVGFSNYVMYGSDKNGVPSIKGISTDIKINLNDGYRIVYQNGEIVSKILYSTFQLFNK